MNAVRCADGELGLPVGKWVCSPPEGVTLTERMTHGTRRFTGRLVVVALALLIVVLVLAATTRSWVLLCVAASLGPYATGATVALGQDRRTD